MRILILLLIIIFACFVVASINKGGQNVIENLKSSVSLEHKEKRHKGSKKNASQNTRFGPGTDNDFESESDSDHNDTEDEDMLKSHNPSWPNKKVEEMVTIVLIHMSLLIFIGYLLGEILKLE